MSQVCPLPVLPANPNSADFHFFYGSLTITWSLQRLNTEARLPLLLNALARDVIAIFDGLQEPKASFDEARERLTEHFSGIFWEIVCFYYDGSNFLKLGNNLPNPYLHLLVDYDGWPRIAIFMIVQLRYATFLSLALRCQRQARRTFAYRRCFHPDFRCSCSKRLGGGKGIS